MPFQNRVDPLSRLHAHPSRGMFTGNRGCLHNERGEIVRDWRSPAWVTCVLEFRDRKRTPMTPGEYTHLFFLDEATALAAGHRPCGECRKADYKAFGAAIARTRRVAAPPSADELNRDRAEELTPALREGLRVFVDASLLPPGAMVATGGRALLVLEEGVRPWSFEGYGRLEVFPPQPVARLTPRVAIEALEGGYRPVLHPSAPVG